MPFISPKLPALLLALGAAYLASGEAAAAYRVYQYVISAAGPVATPRAYLDTSTLPPTAYQTYHGSTLVQVDLLRSWPCYGDTSQRPYCPAPGDQNFAPPTEATAHPLPGVSYEN